MGLRGKEGAWWGLHRGRRDGPGWKKKEIPATEYKITQQQSGKKYIEKAGVLKGKDGKRKGTHEMRRLI